MNIQQMSLQAALIIAVIVIVRALGMGKLPKWSHQAMWGIALLRLLIPFEIESPLSVYGALDRVRVAFEPVSTSPQVVANAAANAAAPIALPMPVAIQNATANVPPFSPWLALWIIGALLLAGYFLWTHLRCRRMYAQALPFGASRIHGMEVAVRISDRIDAPLTYGVVAPVVLLPKRLGTNAYEYVLAHELAHIRHFDTLKKWLLTLALCVHWFNPMVWVMFILANRDIELMCDESVVRTFGDGAKASYATMLIDLMEERGGLVPLASHFSRNAIEERIVAIMKYKKVSLAAVCLAIVLVVSTATALATNAVSRSQVPVANAVSSLQASPSSVDKVEITHGAQGSFDSVYDTEEAAEAYEPYAAFGLTYDLTDGRLYYDGELVRYFEDMYPIGNGGMSGMLMQHADGTVDVHGVRELTDIKRNPDGSFDPSGTLVDVERYTQAEFDARTKEFSDQKPFNGGVSLETDTAFADWNYDKQGEDGVWVKMDPTTGKIIGYGTYPRFEAEVFDYPIADVTAQSDDAWDEAGTYYPSTEIIAQSEDVWDEYEAFEYPTTEIIAQSDDGLPDVMEEDIYSFPEGYTVNPGETVSFNALKSFVERYNAVKAYLDGQVREGLMDQAEADEILSMMRD